MTLNINRYNADMHRYVTICKICEICEICASMQDMYRYTQIWVTFCRACRPTLIWKSWLKIVRIITRYARYAPICHNMLSNGEPQSSVICSNSPVWYVATVHWYDSIYYDMIQYTMIWFNILCNILCAFPPSCEREKEVFERYKRYVNVRYAKLRDIVVYDSNRKAIWWYITQLDNRNNGTDTASVSPCLACQNCSCQVLW